MSDDCYWRHGTPGEKRYPCFDGKNIVCPLCCVEQRGLRPNHPTVHEAAPGNTAFFNRKYTIPSIVFPLESITMLTTVADLSQKQKSNNAG